MESFSPLISVIVPVYNCSTFIDECINSIIEQDYKTIEILLVDDGSTDGSGIICDENANKDERIKVIHTINGGQSKARNIALDMAKGEFITFIDADDYLMTKDSFSSCINELLNDKSLGFVEIPYEKNGNIYNNRNLILLGRENLYYYWLTDKTLTNYLWDKVFRKEIFENLRLPEEMIFEDRYIFPEILNRCNKVKLINKGKYYYRMHKGQTTQRKENTFILESKVKADLNIIKNIPKGLSSIKLMILWRALINDKKLGGHHISKIDENIFTILFSRIPKGIKLRLVILRLFGFNKVTSTL